ncbi:MAG: hypothetical protein JWN76_2360 [Chitinophagaceae bacterium]|nr:hypothetical protein [Chitinophagaceae bacterium]
MNERAYFILSVNHLNSWGCGSSFLLLDHFIKENGGSGLMLDFEGSNDKEVAFFYSGYGAQNEVYPALYFNHLPRLIRFLKPSTPPVPFLQTSFQ